MNTAAVTGILGNSIYFCQAVVAVWGAFLVVIVWRRIAQARFRSEAEQARFLEELDGHLAQGSWDAATSLCEQDLRAVPQLAGLAIRQRQLGLSKVRGLVAERFKRDVIADLEYRVSWINTVIKSAPMLGLLGTVAGMMSAFAKLASSEKVNPTMLSSDISLALITTIVGLCIAIPLILAIAAINVRMRKMEDLVGAGLGHFLDSFKQAIRQTKAAERWSPADAASPVAAAVPAGRRG